MTRRAAFSLLELIVVLAILATLLALSLPALQRARSMAARTACANHLRQIGLAVHSAFDGQGTLPAARECPAPWRGGRDVPCRTLPTADHYTGPNERWWSPYDNRPGTTPTRSLADFAPAGSLWEFVGRDRRLFTCPEAQDRSPNSPARGETFQVAFALNPDVAGKRLGANDMPHVVAWEHDDLPVCAFGASAPHWTPHALTAAEVARRHFAARHSGVANVLYRDGSVSAQAER